MFGLIKRFLTRLLSPEVIKQEILPQSQAGPDLTVQPAPPPLPPVHRDPKTDTAVIKLENVRQEAKKAMQEAKDVCEKAKKSTAVRR